MFFFRKSPAILHASTIMGDDHWGWKEIRGLGETTSNCPLEANIGIRMRWNITVFLDVMGREDFKMVHSWFIKLCLVLLSWLRSYSSFMFYPCRCSIRIRFRDCWTKAPPPAQPLTVPRFRWTAAPICAVRRTQGTRRWSKMGFSREALVRSLHTGKHTVDTNIEGKQWNIMELLYYIVLRTWRI